MSAVEVFLDDTPGEARGILTRDGQFERLIIQRENDPPQHRLGAVSIGRITRIQAAFRAAFVDLGCDGPSGFLPLGGGQTLREGEAVEVEVVAEPRDAKGPALRLLGAATGTPRLVSEGPSVRQVLATLAPGVDPHTGLLAIRAGDDAGEEALATRHISPEFALDLSLERTRALVAVDIDYADMPGRDARKARDRANREGLRQTARLLTLKGWAGLIAVDLIGTTFDPKVVAEMAKGAFGPSASIGPISRFGLLQVAMHWRVRPIEERLMRDDGRGSLETRAIDLARRLRGAMLSNTAAPKVWARCAPEEAAAARSLVERLGPRAALRPDPAVTTGCSVIEQE